MREVKVRKIAITLSIQVRCFTSTAIAGALATTDLGTKHRPLCGKNVVVGFHIL